MTICKMISPRLLAHSNLYRRVALGFENSLCSLQPECLERKRNFRSHAQPIHQQLQDSSTMEHHRMWKAGYQENADMLTSRTSDVALLFSPIIARICWTPFCICSCCIRTAVCTSELASWHTHTVMHCKKKSFRYETNLLRKIRIYGHVNIATSC